MNRFTRRSFRIPRWVFILGAAGLALISIVVVGLGILAFQVGSQLVAVARDAPAYISEQAEKAAADPGAAAALHRKLACIDLAGGPKVNEAFTFALDAAPTAELRTRLETLGERIGLPRPVDAPTGKLFSQCVWGSQAST